VVTTKKHVSREVKGGCSDDQSPSGRSPPPFTIGKSVILCDGQPVKLVRHPKKTSTLRCLVGNLSADGSKDSLRFEEEELPKIIADIKNTTTTSQPMSF
jgi:hypothetical protein